MLWTYIPEPSELSDKWIITLAMFGISTLLLYMISMRRYMPKPTTMWFDASIFFGINLANIIIIGISFYTKIFGIAEVSSLIGFLLWMWIFVVSFRKFRKNTPTKG
jgi:hypothetical protein